ALSLNWLARSRAPSPSSPSSSLLPFYRPFTCEVWGRSPQPRSQHPKNAGKAKFSTLYHKTPADHPLFGMRRYIHKNYNSYDPVLHVNVTNHLSHK
ncbi:unnamed protein product, partial [Prunus brigantina]